jgi:hypothetical protein
MGLQHGRNGALSASIEKLLHHRFSETKPTENAVAIARFRNKARSGMAAMGGLDRGLGPAIDCGANSRPGLLVKMHNFGYLGGILLDPAQSDPGRSEREVF